MKKYILVGCLFLTACANPNVHWEKPNVTPQERARDANECLMQASTILGNRDSAYSGLIFQNAKFRCLYGKGYTAMCGDKVCSDNGTW
jgi:uncharacterized lipoprotein YajG